MSPNCYFNNSSASSCACFLITGTPIVSHECPILGEPRVYSRSDIFPATSITAPFAATSNPKLGMPAIIPSASLAGLPLSKS